MTSRIRTAPITMVQEPQELLTLQQARKLKEMLQVDLARLVGLTQTAISFVETGVLDVPKKDRPKWEWALGAEGRIAWPD